MACTRLTKKGFLLLFLLVAINVNAQLFHVNVHMNNTDVKTRKKLNLLITKLTQNNAALLVMNQQLETTLKRHKDQLNKRYTSNKYDKEDSFIANSLNSASLSLAPLLLATYKNMPYLPRSKREYLNDIAMEKSILLALQYIDPKKVSSDQRQEIYRLRSQLLREFSKTNRDSRNMLLLPILGMAIMNQEAFIELQKTLDNIEITF